MSLKLNNRPATTVQITRSSDILALTRWSFLRPPVLSMVQAYRRLGWPITRNHPRYGGAGYGRNGARECARIRRHIAAGWNCGQHNFPAVGE